MQVIPNAKKFYFSGIYLALEEKLDKMYSGVVVSSEHAQAPSREGAHTLCQLEE